MFVLTPENTCRKVDPLGRVVIPANLRKRLQIEPNDELQFFTLEYEDNQYLCLTNGRAVDPRYSVAADVLRELGLELPEELAKALK